MNRHRTYWSVMGIEPNPEQSQKSKDFEEFREHVKTMLCKYDSTDVLTVVRKVYEEVE